MAQDSTGAQATRDYYDSTTFEVLEGPRISSFCEELKRPQTWNFVLDFGPDAAWAALNLNPANVHATISKQRPAQISTRWINIWNPEKHKASIKVLSDHYDFSIRLQGLMCSDPPPPEVERIPTTSKPQSKPEVRESSLNGHVDEESAGSVPSAPIKVESEPDEGLGFNHYMMVNDIWQSFSVDYGQNYVCIGYNSLHTVPGVSFVKSGSVPDCKRVWIWLILCHDGTVITIHENPFPFSQLASLTSDSVEGKSLAFIRKNVLNIFWQISSASSGDSSGNALLKLQVRQFLQSGNKGADQASRDAPSLLFYYIFDDWYSAYSLIAQKGHQYQTRLEDLRNHMFAKPMVNLVEQLHLLGRQLSILKRIYESYVLIIDRLLQRQRGLRHEARTRQKSSARRTIRQDTTVEIDIDDHPDFQGLVEDDPQLGVPLSEAAIVRFERLRDRINLYALSQIEECLTEKESLVFLTLNLITLKESQAVEKLTRTTILLAKVTILFLPVSLMTGYFSVQIHDLQGLYTARTYWVCFAVIMVLSILLLIGFGVLSDTLDGKPVFNGITRTFLDMSKGRFDQHRKKKN